MYANARNVVTILHGPFIASGIGVMRYASIAPDRIHSAPHGAQAGVQAISLWWATRSLNAYRKRPEVLAETSPHRLIRKIRIIVSGVLPSAPAVSLHARLTLRHITKPPRCWACFTAALRRRQTMSRRRCGRCGTPRGEF